ncbi:dipeptide ABC transporter ATP-binding protein [Maritalea porphyrae]|uniref:ABC transporter ATP-binding protein n=1 Tax=Maritalea porphyrae TaxID=880732 RepID=A0ABQ5UTQ2_9HYPH|nr:ABC transporter ATP-binding protein [Maritalea porphyrae]GLQ17705.1 ABC transporter ATP-binding protein [Maritalea porphyrae]
MSLVEVKDLSISFGDHAVVHAISLSIDPGQRVGVVGESGSGKSLTALSIIDLLPESDKTKGDIVRNVPTGESLRGKHIGMVFQEPMTALNPLMKVGDQIREALELHLPGIDFVARVAELIEEVELPPSVANRYPHELSGGQRQRIGLAIALAGEPELLIADEPTSALDMITQAQIIALIKRVCKAHNMALLFISHDLGAVAALCDFVHVLERGKQVESGTTSSVLKSPQQAYTKRLIAAAKPTRRRLTTRTIGPPLLELDGISKRFKLPGPIWAKKSYVQALSDISLTIREAECVGLVGPSGCGKTTLSRIIAGLQTAQRGTIQFDGHAYGRKLGEMPRAARRELSMVFQDPFGSFDPRLNMAQSLYEPLNLMPELDHAERRERVHMALERVGLTPEMLKRHPHAFSGGQRQRLAIARALVLRPKLVVLDEPVSALDVSIRGDVLELLADLRENFGIAYLFVSHDLDVVRAVADRVLVMDKGKIVEQGDVDTVFDAPQAEITQRLLDARLGV